jgi:hypothetical protein
MSETRRDLFKTSVISAVSVATLSGCGFFANLGGGHNPAAQPGVPILMQNNDGTWYAFLFVNNLSQCAVLKITSAVPAPAIIFDTTAWYNLPTTTTVPATSPLTLVNGSISMILTFGQYLDSGSLAKLNTVLTNNLKQTPGSWNEIGSA